MKKNFLILAIICIFASNAIAAGQTTVSRIVPPISAINQEFSVTLNIQTVPEASGLIISETIPSDWKIISADSACNINQEKQLIKCLTYGNDINKPISYTLKSPSTKTKNGLINGEWKTLSANGQITGGLLQIIEPKTPDQNKTPEPLPPQQPKIPTDPTILLIMAGMIILLIVLFAIVLLLKKKKLQ